MMLRIILLLLMTSFFAGPVQAQFVIENAKVVLEVSGGDRKDGAVFIHNPSREEMNVRVYWEDFEYVAPYDGSKKFGAAGTLNRSAGAWVSYTPQEFKIPALGKQKIDYTITIPPTIEGGYYGVLFFEKVDASSLTTTGVQVVYRTGALFFIEAKDKVKKAEFQGLKIVDSKKFVTEFVNQGDVVLIPRMTYYIMDENALIVDRGDVPATYLPPAGAASIEIDVPLTLYSGTYTFVLNADLDEGDVAVSEVEFVKDAAGSITVNPARM
jgi:hypothetical protein